MKRLALSAASIGDAADRTKVLEQVFRIEMEEFAPFAYLYSPVTLYASSKNTTGYTVYADGSADYRFVFKK
jgi:hypothetical protein